MSTQAQETAVTQSIVVQAPVDRAFRVFTEGMGSWWHPEHHILRGELAEMVFEPRVGGHIYDRATDGEECHWARVLAYDPPRRLVFSWDISLQWEIETDPERTSEVEVVFEPLDQHSTRVTLEHRHLDRHGQGWETMAAGVGSDDGWLSGLRRFADSLSATTD